ncbi:hypothetical protein ABIA06_003107 [Bradyrhizobium yuanmingense]
MCGICGFIGWITDKSVTERNLTRCVQRLAHRGPDASGSCVTSSFAFAPRRLSIIDPDPRSNQPFLDVGLTVTYNGEILPRPKAGLAPTGIPLSESVPCNQRLDPGRENKILGDCILYSAQTTAEFISIGERVPLSNERVQLRKAAVLKRDARRASLPKFACEEASIVKIAETAIPVNEYS